MERLQKPVDTPFHAGPPRWLVGIVGIEMVILCVLVIIVLAIYAD